MPKSDGFSLDGHGGARVCFECSEVLEVWFDNDPMEPNPRMVVGMEDGGVAGGIGRAEFVAALRQMADWIEGYGRETVTPQNCLSTHGGAGYAEGSRWDNGAIVCGLCGARIENPWPTGSYNGVPTWPEWIRRIPRLKTSEGLREAEEERRRYNSLTERVRRLWMRIRASMGGRSD